MKHSSLLFVLLLVGSPAWTTAHAQQATTVDVGHAFFGCKSLEYYAKIGRYAMHREMRAFAKSLLNGVRTGKCAPFKTGQKVILVDAASHPRVVQVRLKKNGPTYWTLKKRLRGATPPLPDNFGNVVTKLYVGDKPKQPLLVTMRGSGGGNDWATARYKSERSKFLKRGYAVLALGYFAGRHNGPEMKGLPKNLDRISLNAVHKAILKAAKTPNVNGQCIAVVGSSRGSELALLLGSYFNDIKAVVAMKPSDVAYWSATPPFTTSSWYYNGKPVPFVPTDGRALIASLKLKPGEDTKRLFEIARQDDAQIEKAKIHVEDINGPVLLISGASDHKWPSTKMANLIIERLKAHDFPYFYEHITVKGGHEAPEKHFDAIRNFLDRYFKSGNGSGCARE
jgi:dienelactone hydrolase